MTVEAEPWGSASPDQERLSLPDPPETERGPQTDPLGRHSRPPEGPGPADTLTLELLDLEVRESKRCA